MTEMITVLNGGSGRMRFCPECQIVMRLVGIEPHYLTTCSDEIYTFECVGCGITTAEAVAKDFPLRIQQN
jgi:hypothetical protein